MVARASATPGFTSITSLSLAFAAALLLFSPIFAHARILAIGDGLIESLPAFFASTERWQPAMFVGFPIYADPNKAFWYPLRLLRYMPDGFNAYVITAYGLSAWATYGYVRGITGYAVAGVASAAAFAFGGFMISHIGQPMVAQPAAWACVAIWALAAFIRHRQGRWLVAMAASEALSIASGQPQVAAFTIVLLFAYLFWFGYAGRSRRTIRVYLEGVAAIALGVTMAAIALLPTIALGTSSIRSGLDFGAYVVDPLPVAHVARMLTYPFAEGGGVTELYGPAIVSAESGLFTEATIYVGLAALALVAVAAFGPQRRVAAFWLVVACIAVVLAVGDTTPLAAVTFGFPGFNLFRIPGRHAFEFTLAASICAGLGVSAIASASERRFALPIGLVAIACVGLFATLDVASQANGYLRAPAVTVFLAAFALEFTLLCVVAASRLAPRIRAALACAAVVTGTLPFAATAYWRDAPAVRVLARPGYVRLLERLPFNWGQRVYAESGSGLRELQANLPTLWSVPDVGGYTPLQLATVHILLQTGADGRLLNTASRMVDLAAVRYFAVPLRAEVGLTASAPFDSGDLQTFLSIGRPEAPRDAMYGLSQPRKANRLALITALGTSVNVPQGRTVATLTLQAQSGRRQVLRLRAGIETAEFAYERPDVLAKIRHKRAARYERYGSNTWYTCSLPVNLSGPVASIQIHMVDSVVALNVRKISLIDTTTNRAYPFSSEARYFADKRHFRHIGDSAGVSLFENLQSMPAVWIARAVLPSPNLNDDAKLAAFRESLGRTKYHDDAFARNAPDVPTLPLGGAATLVTDESEHRVVRATCPRTCLLVSSATFTTDWSAAVDGRRARLIPVDGMLQGVVIPSGRHRIDFRYEPWAGFIGISVSCIAAAVFLVWMLLRRRPFGSKPNATRSSTGC